MSMYPGGARATTSDTALVEDALDAALAAHTDGKLAAPFGVDEVALRAARRRATRADIARSLRLTRAIPNGDCAEA